MSRVGSLGRTAWQGLVFQDECLLAGYETNTFQSANTQKVISMVFVETRSVAAQVFRRFLSIHSHEGEGF